ncbi:MAG: hypothetical protein II988_01090 [Clostridia bacterium]|nr:hypothetical protein [Clostridia bacterium]
MVAFGLLLYAIVGSIACNRQRKNDMEKAYYKQYMQSIPVDEEGYELSFEDGILAISYRRIEKTVLNDGETTLEYRINDGLYLIHNEEEKEIGFSFLLGNSEKFRKIAYLWDEYWGTPLEERVTSLSVYGSLLVSTDGVDVYYIYKYRLTWDSSASGNLEPTLFRYDISEDKVYYLGHYPDFEKEQGLKDVRIFKNN